MKTFSPLIMMLSAALGQIPSNSSPAGLVLPKPGNPLSCEQIERRERTALHGTSYTEEIKSRVYRDLRGRIRLESESESEGQTTLITLSDIEAGSSIILVPSAKIAARMTAPKTGGIGFARPGLDGAEPGNWAKEFVNLGIRRINDVDCEGTRTTQKSQDGLGLVAIYETWTSKSLGITCSVDEVGPRGKYTARIRNIKRLEPDPALFSVPDDYSIKDFRFPQP